MVIAGPCRAIPGPEKRGAGALGSESSGTLGFRHQSSFFLIDVFLRNDAGSNT